ncbi:MAG: hypothetical protein DHS20C11_17120 [Lysobacteraceae bacterium]|nr:MAG: hypothetical protein DHS20C11_17120 [Xanthomonadaceae bacterium]
MSSDLTKEIIDLGPWHLDVEVTPGLSTAVAKDVDYDETNPQAGIVSFIDARDDFRKLIHKVYPDGLSGKAFLDSACNCGGYSFWARELGANRCFGYDVRDHWINQAKFLHEKRGEPDSVEFSVTDLYDLPKLGLEPFELTLFKGIFYHLPDPIAGLKCAADLTKEVMILNTATREGQPDGMLAIAKEGLNPLMSGVYGLNWFPTGPRVLKGILQWMGFTDVRVIHHWPAKPDSKNSMGRIEIIAARSSGMLDAFEEIS